MSWKVLITGSHIAGPALELLADNGVETVMLAPYAKTEEFCAIVDREQPDAFIVRMGDVNAQVIAASRRLRVISKHGVGVNNIDVGAATKKGIPVTVTIGANSRSVAEHALAMMLALIKDLRPLDAMIRAGKWEKAGYASAELTGKRLGLIGIGSIGHELVELVRPFRMEVSVFDPNVSGASLGDGVRRVENLDQLLAGADVVSLHCPLTTETKNLIGAEQLGRMKDTALLVNTARGGIIDEAALVGALRRGDIAGAGLDGFELEPPAADNPLWELPNVILTPHIGGASEESLVRVGMMAARNVIDFLDRGALDAPSVVNASVLEKV